MRKSLAALSLFFALMSPAIAHATEARAPAGKVVLVAFSGIEDMMRLVAPFRHAVMMKKTGRLEAVAIVVYARGVLGLVRGTRRPNPLRDAIEAAHKAGVPIYVCEQALAARGYSKAQVVPEARPVPSGAVKLAELISEGYVPLQY